MTSSSREKIADEVLFTINDEERLQHTDAEECAFEWAAELEPEHRPESVKVEAFVRRKCLKTEPSAEVVLEYVLEGLDEEYGDPDGAPDPTPAMREAAEAFVAVIRKEYVPWICDRAPSFDVVVRIKDNPDFLEYIA